MAKVEHRFTGQDYVVSVPETRLKFKDVFDMKGVYTIMRDWLVEEGYAPSSDQKFKEIFYHHRWTQTAGEEVRFWWRMGKEGTSYYTYEIDINVLVIGLQTTEVIYHGKKFKTNMGEVEIKVHGRIIADCDKKWRNHVVLKHFHPLFYKRIFFKNMEMHRKELYKDIYRFSEMLKTHFKLKKYRPEPEGEQFFATHDYE